MKNFQDILPPQPHHLTGYTGFVPGYITACGQSYGKLTHQLFYQSSNRSGVPVLSDINSLHDDRTCTVEEEDSLNKRCADNLNCKYTTSIIPGYAGYVPQYIYLCGKKYTLDATKGINNFLKIRNSCSCPQCEEKQRSLKLDKKNINYVSEDNKYTHPFKKDFEAEQLFKEKHTPTVPIPPTDTTYFLENGNHHKKFMVGYAGHVPNLLHEFGHSYTPATKDALNIFTDQYKKHKLTLY